MCRYHNRKDCLVQIVEKWGTPFFFFLLFFLLPTNNSTVDGWGYAEEIKYGYKLFRPHHLLYNALGYVLINGFKVIGFYPDVLLTLKTLNALSAFGILIVLKSILERMELTISYQNLWLFFVGSSFGFLRFATENEVYVIPMLFSLLGSLYFWLFLKDYQSRHLILSSFFASLACLFHQLHIFWWFALLIGLFFKPTDKKSIGTYLLISLIVPLSYIAVLFFYEHENITIGTILSFVLHDYHSGGAEATIDFRNFILTPISFFRTFFQVHGNIILLLKSFPWLYFLAGLALTLGVGSIFQLKKNCYLGKDAVKKTWFRVHLLAFTLHLLFAFFSHGNAEFMVVLVVLIPILVSQVYQLSLRFIALFSLSMFIWNISLAIVPNNRINYTNDEALITFIKQHPDAIFILSDKNVVANRYFYESGVSISHRLYSFPIFDFQTQLCSLQNAGVSIYTDLLNRSSPINRERMLQSKNLEDLILKSAKIKTINSFYGSYTIDKVEMKCD